MAVHRALGPGFLEKIYENALAIELRKQGLCVEQQKPLIVRYDGNVVGEYQADMIVDHHILLELKAIERIADVHCAQLKHYLRATGLPVGLLINFGAPSLDWKRKDN